MLEDPSFSDVAFQVKNTKFTAHKNVLASRSVYFRTMFFSGFNEGGGDGGGGGARGEVAAVSSSAVPRATKKAKSTGKAAVKAVGSNAAAAAAANANASPDSSSSSSTIITIGDTTPSAFKALLRYLYTDVFEFEDEDILSVMRKANEYQLDRLYNHTVRYCNRNISEENVVIWLIQADEFQLADLRDSTLQFLAKNFSKVRAKDGESFRLLKENPDLLLEVMLIIKVGALLCNCSGISQI